MRFDGSQEPHGRNRIGEKQGRQVDTCDDAESTGDVLDDLVSHFVRAHLIEHGEWVQGKFETTEGRRQVWLLIWFIPSSAGFGPLCYLLGMDSDIHADFDGLQFFFVFGCVSCQPE